MFAQIAQGFASGEMSEDGMSMRNKKFVEAAILYRHIRNAKQQSVRRFEVQQSIHKFKVLIGLGVVNNNFEKRIIFVAATQTVGNVQCRVSCREPRDKWRRVRGVR